jgi:hypothetical protein
MIIPLCFVATQVGEELDGRPSVHVFGSKRTVSHLGQFVEHLIAFFLKASVEFNGLGKENIMWLAAPTVGCFGGKRKSFSALPQPNKLPRSEQS